MTAVRNINDLLSVNALRHERTACGDIHPSVAATRSVSSTPPMTRRIGIVLSEGFSLLRVGAIVEIFQLANEHTRACSPRDVSGVSGVSGVSYDVKMLSSLGGSLPSGSSAHMLTERFQLQECPFFDALFVVDGRGLNSGLYAQLLAARSRLGSSDPDGSRTGCTVTAADATQQTCVVDTSADAVLSALSLVERDLGTNVAREIAERVSPGAKSKVKVDLLLRDIGHKTIEERVRATALWLDENCTEPISVADAVQVAMMSSRSFSRHFKLQLGVTPSEFLLRARLDLVFRMLIETDLPVEKIARRCGIGNGDRLGKIFRQTLHVSPTQYRMRRRTPPLNSEPSANSSR